MTKTIPEIQWNNILYIDCLDEQRGLPSLPDKCVKLGYTDYPWGSDMKQNIRTFEGGRILDNNNNKIFFNDSKSTITEEWTLKWFFQLERVCWNIVLVIPEAHKKFWYRNTDPTEDVPVLWKNGFSSTRVANKSRKSSYLFYGKFKRGHRLKYNIIAKRYSTHENPIIEPFTLKWGFCSDQRGFVHPSPKGIDVALVVLKQLKPESLLDPFAGSGSYLKAADILGIKWLGYEINPDYKIDMNKRRSERSLDNYL